MAEDPTSLLTYWQTEKKGDYEQSRITSKEQMEYYMANDFTSTHFGLDFMGKEVVIDKRAMIASDGKGREENTAILARMEKDKVEQTGLTAVKRILKDQQPTQ